MEKGGQMQIWKNSGLIEKNELEKAHQRLIQKAKLDFDFAFLSFAGLATCVLGMSLNSDPIVIGAMIISPLLYSILVLPAALIWEEKRVFLNNFKNLLIQVIIGVVFCSSLAYILGIQVQNVELISELGQNALIYFFVAAIAGTSATLSLFWPGVPEKVTGVAVSVALVPPIAIMGIALSNQNTEILISATENLTLNFLGILIGAYSILKVIQHQV
ncbi:MAG: DUF389 domain-containing protein [Patescibacteria group bacterium]